jgi:hypothetical protein
MCRRLFRNLKPFIKLNRTFTLSLGDPVIFIYLVTDVRCMFVSSIRSAVCFIITITPFLAGCGGESLTPVTGSVMVKGKPAVGASVMFFPEGSTDIKAIPGSGVVDENGAFSISSGTTPGLKPGKYIVTVVWPDPAKKPTDLQRMAGANPNDAPDVLGGRYATKEKSTLRAEVKSGATKLEPFDLK